MKISLVGPSYPFRGGIAHHTTLLYRHLRRRHDVTFYSFKRQYPRRLFPGRTDIDRSLIAIKESDAENILDSMNPLTWWHVFRKIKNDTPDLVIFPWWVSFWTPQFWTISTLIKRSKCTKILFICHNVIPHESKLIDTYCRKFVLNKGDYFLVHSEEDLRNLKKVVPNAHVKKVLHPNYNIFHVEGYTKEEAQNRLNMKGNSKRLWFCGKY